MCGRFKITSPPEIVAEAFGLADASALAVRYNVAPSQSVAVVRLDHGARKLALVRWGLVPSWAKDPAIGHRLINARAETVDEKPAFRRAFAERRCLVVSDGFYEWKRDARGRKTPYLFTAPDERPFGLAGLWETWRRGDETIESCTILTAAANEAVAPVHDRMPVVVAPALHSQWLDPHAEREALLSRVLEATARAALKAVVVGRHVNDPRHDDPSCVAPASADRDRDPPA